MLNVTFLAVLPYVWGDLKSAARTERGLPATQGLADTARDVALDSECDEKMGKDLVGSTEDPICVLGRFP